MNERIKELATKCANQRSEFNGHMIYTFADNSLEKFAELIVKECENSIKLVPTHYEAQDKIIVECLKAIRETFRS
jgi:hypothetical protein